MQVVVHETAGLDRQAIPIRFGLPLNPGVVSHPWQLFDGDRTIPTQSTVLGLHPDGSPANLRVDALLDSIRGNARKTLTLKAAVENPLPAPTPLKVEFDDQGLNQLSFRNCDYLAGTSALPVVGISKSTTQVFAGPPRHRFKETIQPTIHSSKRMISGELVEEWQISGGVGVEDDFSFLTSLRIHKQIPRIDVHTRLRNRFGPRYLSHFAHTFQLTKPDAAEILTHDDQRFPHLVDVNLAAETLLSGWSQSGVRLTYPNDQDLVIATQDLSSYNDGMITLTNVGREQDTTECLLHRIEPVWHYRGITSHAPASHLHFHEGQTRSAHFSLYFGNRTETEHLLISGESGLEVWVEDLVDSRTVLSKGRIDHKPLLERTVERALGFVIPSGEYKGLLAGGRCHINHRLIEYGVNRADYAEYLLNHFLRTQNPSLLEKSRNYADAFVDIAIHRSEEMSDGWGAVRQRYRENLPDQVRSMRGPRLLFKLFDLTGETAYRDTAMEIGNYILKSFPDRFARQGGACRELAELFTRSGDTAYASKTFEILNAVRESQLPEGPWYEHYQEDGSSSVLDVHQAGLYTIVATEKPEMSSYNIIGILDAQKQLDITPWMDVVEKASDWMVTVQDDEGAWRFPKFDSDPQWGHGIFQDVLAMLLAYQTFQKPAYLDSADRAIAWAEKVWAEYGYIPSVTRQTPHQYLEASLTYFYGIEALSLRMEI